MLIDVSRRPVRLVTAECPSVVVIRTMAVRGTTKGFIYKNKESLQPVVILPMATVRNGTIQKPVTLRRDKVEFKKPSEPLIVTLLRDKIELMETILPTPLTPLPSVNFRPERPELYAISGFQDQISNLSGIWRINFILDFIKRKYLLTLFDETNSVMLFTIQVPPSELHTSPFMTPLQRWEHNQQRDDTDNNLWKAIIHDGF
jgi:hypothetical protein